MGGFESWSDIVDHIRATTRLGKSNYRQLNSDCQLTFKVAVVGIGDLGRETVEELKHINDANPAYPFSITELYLFSRDRDKALTFRRQLLTDKRRKDFPEIIADTEDRYQKYEGIDITIVTAESNKNREFRKWCGQNDVFPSRSINTLENAIMLRDLAPKLAGEGAYVIVTNDSDACAQVFAQQTKADPRRIVGMSHLDQIRLHTLLTEDEQARMLQDYASTGRYPHREEWLVLLENAHVIGVHADPRPALEDLIINRRAPRGINAEKLSKRIAEHASDQVIATHRTHSETKNAILDLVTAIMEEGRIVTVSAPLETGQGWLYATQPVKFNNLNALQLKTENGLWIDQLGGEDRMQLEQRLEKHQRLLQLLTGDTRGLQGLLEEWLVENAAKSNLGLSALRAKAAELAAQYKPVLEQEKPLVRVHMSMPAKPPKERPPLKPASLTLTQGEGNPQYEALGLEGKIALLDDAVSAVTVYNLADWTSQERLAVQRVRKLKLEQRAVFVLSDRQRPSYNITEIHAGLLEIHKSVELKHQHEGMYRDMAVLPRSLFILYTNDKHSVAQFDWSPHEPTIRLVATHTFPLPAVPLAFAAVELKNTPVLMFGLADSIHMYTLDGKLASTVPFTNATDIRMANNTLYACDGVNVALFDAAGNKLAAHQTRESLYAPYHQGVITVEGARLVLHSGRDRIQYATELENPHSVHCSGNVIVAVDGKHLVVQSVEQKTRPTIIRLNSINLQAGYDICTQ